MDPCRAFWPAGDGKAIVRGAPSTPSTKFVSPAIQEETGRKNEQDCDIDDEGKGVEDEEKARGGKKEKTKTQERKGGEQAGPSSRERGTEDGGEQAGPSSQRKAKDPVENSEIDDVEWLAAVEEEAEDNSPKCAEIPAVPGLPDPSSDFEVRKHRVARKPTLPTKAEIEERFPLHLNYLSWCRHCVAGKARSNAHRRKDESDEKLGVMWSADYSLMGGEYNEEEDGMQASLVMSDDCKDSFWAVGVDANGPTDAMVKYSVGSIEQSGYSGERITFKYDQEPGLVALKASIAAPRIGETVPIESPVRSF